MNEGGLRRAAILLMTLGEEEAAEVFKHLGPKEVQQLGGAIAAMSNVSRDEVELILEEFRAATAHRANLGAADAYIRSVLTRALGSDKAGNLLDRILQGGENKGIENLRWMDAIAVAELIRHEHPQIIATILVHLEYEQAGQILKQFSERLRNDVMLRIATLEGVQPTALRDLNEVLMQLLSGSEHSKKSTLGGAKAVAEILNAMGGNAENAVLQSISEYDPDLAQRIQDKMFLFESLVDLEDRMIQLLLREIQSDVLVIALKGTTESLREKIFFNMSQRAAEMLRDDFEAKGPVKLSEVEAAQKDILKTVKKLADEGQIALSGRGGGEAIVQ